MISLADGVASVYLEFISVDSDVSSKTNSLDMSFCALSTRELQKLRNEVLGYFYAGPLVTGSVLNLLTLAAVMS